MPERHATEGDVEPVRPNVIRETGRRARAPQPPVSLGRRTATIVLAGATVLGVVSFLPNTSASSALALLALLFVGIGGGLVAERWLDAVAVAAGSAVGVLLAGVIQYRSPGGPSSQGSIVSAALFVGAIAAIVSAAGFGLRRLAMWREDLRPTADSDRTSEPPRDPVARGAIGGAEAPDPEIGTPSRFDDEATSWIVATGAFAGVVIGTVVLVAMGRVDPIGLFAGVFRFLFASGTYVPMTAGQPSVDPVVVGAAYAAWLAGVAVAWACSSVLTTVTRADRCLGDLTDFVMAGIAAAASAASLLYATAVVPALAVPFAAAGLGVTGIYTLVMVRELVSN